MSKTLLNHETDSDAELAAAIAEREAKTGRPLSEHIVRSLANLLEYDRQQNKLAWTGKVIEVPGGSPHMVMSREGGGKVSIGPLHTPENAAKQVWTAEELEEERAGLVIDPNLKSK